MKAVLGRQFEVQVLSHMLGSDAGLPAKLAEGEHHRPRHALAGDDGVNARTAGTDEMLCRCQVVHVDDDRNSVESPEDGTRGERAHHGAAVSRIVYVAKDDDGSSL